MDDQELNRNRNFREYLTRTYCNRKLLKLRICKSRLNEVIFSDVKIYEKISTKRNEDSWK